MATQSHLKRVSLLRDLYVEACDSRLVTWVHVRSHGRGTDPTKQHLLPLNERVLGEPCVGSAVANLTCRNCGHIFVHMQAKRLHERFCANIRPEAEGLVYWVCACGFEVRFSHTASHRDRQTAQHKQYIIHKTVKAVELSS